MKILSIETSCDETGIALVEASGGFSNPKFKVLKNLVSSQIKIHRPFGGVVPGLAKREHIRNLPLLLKKLHPKPYTLNPDLIAVTVGPGLEPALWAGIEFATQLRSLIDADSTQTNAEKIQSRRKSALSPRKSAPELVGVNHLEGHLYSFLLTQKTRDSKLKAKSSPPKADPPLAEKLLFPAITLSVSGGHTVLLLMKNLKAWERLGETKDDAAGEAFDKVARMLNLPYPGGPEIEKIAKKGNPETIAFPRPMLNQKNYDFSFSGLKTSVFYYLRERKSLTNADNTPHQNPAAQQAGNGAGKFGAGQAQTNAEKSQRQSAPAPTPNFGVGVNPRKSASRADVAASFQQAVIDVLVAKTMRAAGEYGARSIILCGGVAANKKLRGEFKKSAKKSGMSFFVPNMEYNNDNAAMIAAAGYFASLRRKKLPLRANGDLNI